MCASLRRGSAALAATLLLVTTAEGGQVRWKWWQSDEFQRELSLAPEQVDRIEQVFQESLPALQAGKHDLDRLEGELSALITDSATTEAQVLRMIDRVEASRSALGRTRSLMLFRMHRVLTPEQRIRLTALHEKWEHERRNGPGGLE
jgi:Spy/CpxP family protein refolding chaperone